MKLNGFLQHLIPIHPSHQVNYEDHERRQNINLNTLICKLYNKIDTRREKTQLRSPSGTVERGDNDVSHTVGTTSVRKKL